MPGDSNSFLTVLQGGCTPCHELDAKSGVWAVPSGPEKQAGLTSSPAHGCRCRRR